jgi:hypothetical protein
MTIVIGPGNTRGPSEPPASALTNPMPANPVSDDPIESVMTTFGSASMYCRFTDGEKSEALLEMATSDEASRPPSR